MSYNAAQSIIVLYRPLTLRLVEGFPKAARIALGSLQDAWRDYKARRHEAQAFDALAQLNEHTLKDIGAPESLLAEASDRRAVEHLRRAEMTLGVGL